ncbi:MAG: response regulator transcription factor [Acidimicrobiia bacterium]
MRAVVAEDHYLFREGTRQLLEASGQVEVVAAVGDAPALYEAVDELGPDAVVVDIRMPPDHETEGIVAARRIRADHPNVGVVVLSQYASALYAFELFQEGTRGLAYLLKDRVGDVGELVGAIVAVTEGGSVIDPAVVESLLSRKRTVSKGSLGSLSDREVEVLAEMAQGRSNAAIGESLYISESAVEKHINSIMMKLELDPSDASLNRRVAAVLAFLHSYHPSERGSE